MQYKIVSVGQCGPDDATLERALGQHFSMQMSRVQHGPELMAWLEHQSAHLILVNRKLDCDYTDGTDVIRMVKQSAHAAVPVILISNLPEAQEEARAAGACPGFGKLDYKTSFFVNNVRSALEMAPALKQESPTREETLT